MSLADNPLACALALWRLHRLGPKTFAALQRKYPDLRALFRETPQALSAAKIPPAIQAGLKKPDWAGVAKDLAWLAKPSHTILQLPDAAYPTLLREIADPPSILFVVGAVARLSAPQIAMVGSREPTAMGLETARQFAAQLGKQGMTVTSGLARGIDGASHQAACETPGGTIAVVGTGLDTVYPRSHLALSEAIAAKGALVSEFPIGVPVHAHNFPRRNRLISGLSMGVLVVEAAERSGSLITARLAMEQGREVFAIPGSIHQPQARGCHRLIRQGAKLVETVTDMLEELGQFRGMTSPPSPVNPIVKTEVAPSLSDTEQRFLACLSATPMAMDGILSKSGLLLDQANQLSLLLELKGYIKVQPGGYCRV